MDKLGKADTRYFYLLTWETVFKFIEWDIEYNNIFRSRNTLFLQIKGVPIGGPMAAQLECLYCMAIEHFYLTTRMNSIFFTMPIRFRDNILMVVMEDFSIQEIITLFEKRYFFKFTKEQVGISIKSLEMVVQWDKEKT